MSDQWSLVGFVVHEIAMCRMLAALRGLPNPISDEDAKSMLAPLLDVPRQAIDRARGVK